MSKKDKKPQLHKADVSGSLEFGKPQMNIAALEAKMKKFFDTVSTDELIERFEKLGYEFEPIDGQANDH